MEEKIKNLISNTEIQLNTIEKLLSLKDNTEADIDKYSSCMRFLKGFINDLNKTL